MPAHRAFYGVIGSLEKGRPGNSSLIPRPAQAVRGYAASSRKSTCTASFRQFYCGSDLDTLFVLGRLGSRAAARLKKVELTMGLPELHGHVLDTSSLSP